jgi:hypothetical protein
MVVVNHEYNDPEQHLAVIILLPLCSAPPAVLEKQPYVLV